MALDAVRRWGAAIGPRLGRPSLPPGRIWYPLPLSRPARLADRPHHVPSHRDTPQRLDPADPADYKVVTSHADEFDTTWTDDGLLGDRAYRYRVSYVFAAGGEGKEHRV